MKVDCQIVQDLLPLYEDDMCSPGSRAAVEQHLKECGECRRQWEAVRFLADPEPGREAPGEEQVVKKSFRKVRRRWWGSLIAALLVLPVLWLSVNQYRLRDVCFTNLDDIWAARRYCAALEDGDFEKAAGCMDSRALYESVQDVLDWTLEDYAVEYIPVTIGGLDYVVTRAFYEENLQYGTDSRSFWFSMIYNGVCNFLIPEQAWLEAVAVEPDAVQQIAEGMYRVNNQYYSRVDTRWGVYYTLTDELKDGQLGELYPQALMPAAVYEAHREEFAAQELEYYNFNQEYYAEAEGMGYEEFEEYVNSRYIVQLQRVADLGYTFSITGYEYSYYLEGSDDWTIVYGVELERDGRSWGFDLHISVQEDGLDIGAIGQKNGEPEDLDLAEYLWYGYPEE